MLSVGLVGLPNVGKSTLFQALTKQEVLIADYPFATIDPTTGVVPLPDERLVRLSQISKSQRIVPASVAFIDIAGLVAGASQGQGLGNAFLGHIRQTNVIVQVVRGFQSSGSSSPSTPLEDIDIINTELLLADLDTLTKQQLKLAKPSQGDPSTKALLKVIQGALNEAEAGQNLRDSSQVSLYREELAHLNLLTLKPQLYVFNVADPSQVSEPEKEEMRARLGFDLRAIWMSAQVELEMQSLPEAERSGYMEAYGMTESGLAILTKAAFELLNLTVYFTTGPKETRAWTIQKGALAPQAAGVIHTDFERGFIAAEVVSYEDLVASGSWKGARQLGLVHQEGREYAFMGGEVVDFRFNV